MTALSTILPRLAPQEELQPALEAFTQLDILTGAQRSPTVLPA